MPGHKVHIAIGAGIVAIVLGVIYKFSILPMDLTIAEWIIAVVVTFLYSQMPDIDSDASKVNKYWNTAAGVGALAAIITGTHLWLAALAIVSIVTLEWVKHRGVTHDVWFAALISAPLWILDPLIAVIGFIAYISHIIIDGELGK